MMSFISSLSVAIRGILSNKVRASLTMLGIIIGIAAVICLVSLGKGVTATITNEIVGLGSNLIFVEPGVSAERGALGSAGELTYEDANAIVAANLTSVEQVAPVTSSRAQVIAGDKNLNVTILGTIPESIQVSGDKIDEGKYISNQDIDSRAMVCVLGSKVADYLFKNIDPVGQTMRINSRTFTVVGVMQSNGGLMSSDGSVFVPITTAIYRFGMASTSTGDHRVAYIVVKATSEDDIDAASEQIATLLRARHHILPGKEDDFTVTSQRKILSSLTMITNELTLFLGAIAGIALLVGGVGIMNIMLVSVTERTSEIGIRKAVGAKRRDIMMQFLLEAIMLSLIGAMIGVLCGWGLAKLVSSVGVSLQGLRLTAVITPDVVLLAVGVAAAIGIFFGSWPAMRAARLNPIEALRRD